MLDQINQELNFFQASLNVRARRQEVLSANIANADTPNYKARDIDFAATLEGSVGDRLRVQNAVLNQTSARHFPGQTSGGISPLLLYRQPAQLSLDGNTVEMDQERVQFAGNTLHYQSTVSFVSGKLRTMHMAIQE